MYSIPNLSTASPYELVCNTIHLSTHLVTSSNYLIMHVIHRRRLRHLRRLRRLVSCKTTAFDDSNSKNDFKDRKYDYHTKHGQGGFFLFRVVQFRVLLHKVRGRIERILAKVFVKQHLFNAPAMIRANCYCRVQEASHANWPYGFYLKQKQQSRVKLVSFLVINSLLVWIQRLQVPLLTIVRVKITFPYNDIGISSCNKTLFFGQPTESTVIFLSKNIINFTISLK